MKKTDTSKRNSAKWIETWLDKCDWVTLEIPIMKGLSEGKTSRASFHILSRLADIAEQIVYSSSRFRSRSQVYRAAMYVGLSIIYRICDKDGEINSYGKTFFESVKRNERRLQQAEIIEMLIDEIGALMERENRGTMSAEDVREGLGDLISSIPDDIGREISSMINKALAAKSISGSRVATFLEKDSVVQKLIEDKIIESEKEDEQTYVFGNS